MKRFFLGGLVALLPTVLTLWILTALVGFVGDYVASPATRAIYWGLTTNQIGKSLLESSTPIRIYDPAHIDAKAIPEDETIDSVASQLGKQDSFLLDLSLIDRKLLYADLERRIPPVFGLAVGLVLIFLLGCLMRGYVGRYLFARGEKLLFSFPFVRSIYPYAKKIVEFFLKEKSAKREFQSAVAVPYPSAGMYTLGFITSDGLQSLNDRTGDEFLSVFIPSSPTPMTGYVCLMRRDDIVPLSLTLDQTMGFIISGGVIVPPEELVSPVESPRRSRSPVNPSRANPPIRPEEVPGLVSVEPSEPAAHQATMVDGFVPDELG